MGAPRKTLRKPLVRSHKALAPAPLPKLGDLHTLSSETWSREAERHNIAVFRHAAHAVPAYKRFLKDHKVDPLDIRTSEDFSRLPAVHKSNYLRVSKWNELIASDALNDRHLILAATSGSTGKPFYFPRTSDVDSYAALFHTLFIENSGLDKKRKTLVIIGFGMGVWIGGIITYEAFSRVSEGGFPLTIITAGTNKKEIYEALREAGPYYEQVVVCGYPPFIKDLIDEGKEAGITWSRFDLRILCAAESFSEDFRDYLVRLAGLKDPLRTVISIYGSAELGTMAIETPLTTLLRRLALKKKPLFEKIFGDAKRLPTLAQFIPSCVNFTAVDGSLFCTASNALPLVRYDIGDKGGVRTFTEITAMCADEGIDLVREIRKAGIEDTVCQLPFVYVYERADLSTKLYGAIIYPEHVKGGLQKKQFDDHLTGKFTMMTKHDKGQNEFLEIHLELKPGVAESEELRAQVIEQVVESLANKSDEYRYLSGTVREKVVPRVVLWPHGHPEHFQQGVKQKWVKKA